jgi:hypothetical protein
LTRWSCQTSSACCCCRNVGFFFKEWNIIDILILLLKRTNTHCFEQCKVKITKFGTTISSNIICMLSSERWIFFKEWNIIEILLLRGTNTHCFEQCKVKITKFGENNFSIDLYSDILGLSINIKRFFIFSGSKQVHQHLRTLIGLVLKWTIKCAKTGFTYYKHL